MKVALLPLQLLERLQWVEFCNCGCCGQGVEVKLEHTSLDRHIVDCCKPRKAARLLYTRT